MAQIVCDRPGLTPNADGRGGTFHVAVPPVAVTCTISNTRMSATMTLQKTWVDGAAGDTADLSIAASGPATSASATSTAAGVAGMQIDSVNQASASIFSGATVDVAEVLGTANTGSYTSQIVCDQPGLTANGNGQRGTFQVPDTPAAVTCTITNTRTSVPLTLQKTWVNGAVDDATDLSVRGSDDGTGASATSTASGAAGSETDTVNQAIATVFSGESVVLAEALDATNIRHLRVADCL